MTKSLAQLDIISWMSCCLSTFLLLHALEVSFGPLESEAVERNTFLVTAFLPFLFEKNPV